MQQIHDSLTLGHVLHVVQGNERVVDGDNLDGRVGLRGAHDETADATKACARGEGTGVR